MSAEEIINSWKNEQGIVMNSNERPKTEPGKAPANPAGEQELSDEELALIEGGDGSSTKCSCADHSCTSIA